PAARMNSLCLLPENRVRFLQPLQIDRGGIAKGFAVDEAVTELQRHGIRSGLVNAGGDLRAFGRREQQVHLRHPACLDKIVPLRPLTDCALATSATYFSRKKWHGQWVSSIVDSRRKRPCTARFSL